MCLTDLINTVLLRCPGTPQDDALGGERARPRVRPTVPSTVVGAGTKNAADPSKYTKIHEDTRGYTLVHVGTRWWYSTRDLKYRSQ